jgi:hypothetical protein
MERDGTECVGVLRNPDTSSWGVCERQRTEKEREREPEIVDWGGSLHTAEYYTSISSSLRDAAMRRCSVGTNRSILDTNRARILTKPAF